MNLYLQVVRGFGALAMCAAVSAYALTQPTAMTDGSETNGPDTNGFGVAVAHSRTEINCRGQRHGQCAALPGGQHPRRKARTAGTGANAAHGDAHPLERCSWLTCATAAMR
jgi:hypothetical protein